MRRFILTISIVLSLLAFPWGKAAYAGPKLPVINGKPTLATVNGEPIPLADLRREIGALHEGIADNAAAPRMDPTELLDRMINIRLVLQEARVIGLDELPELKTELETYGKNTRRAMLFGNHVRDIRKPNGKEVDRRYREEVKEVKLASILVEKEDAAKKLEAEVKAGGDFGNIAKRMIDAGEARGNAEGEYLKHKSLLPEVSAALSKVKKGGVSHLSQIGKNYSMVKLLDVRFPKDPVVRRKVERGALEEKRTAALRVYVGDLKKKYVRLNEKLLKDLDFDTPELGIDNLLKDSRIVAEVTGEKPVTVMELSDALRKKFFHGMDKAAQKGMVNRRKNQILDEILVNRVTDKEAKRLKVGRSPEYLNAMEEYRRGILFGMFVQKVIDPGITLDDAEVTAYREKHAKDYTTPEMMRIETVAFADRKDAETAAERLKGGADFTWTQANAEGRVEAEKAKNLLDFGSGPIMTGELPDEVQKAVAGAAVGEYRLYSAPAGPHYVLHIREVIPSAPQSLELVRDDIARKVFEKKRAEALDDYLSNLRAAADVKKFAEGSVLKRVVREHGR